MKDQLSLSGVVNSGLAVPLFDCLLRVALAQVSAPITAFAEKPERVRVFLVNNLHFISDVI